MALKRILRDEETKPLIAYKFYPMLLQIQEKQRGMAKVVSTAGVLSEMPANAQALLSFLLELLMTLAANVQSTQMTAENLGYTFAPCILRPKDLASDLQKVAKEQGLANEIIVEMINNKEPIFENISSAAENDDEVKMVSDDLVEMCVKCGTEFGLMTRKHHCKYCGQIFCKKCASNKVEKKRVCDACWAKHGGK